MSIVNYKKVVEALLRPFKKHLLFLIAFFVLATSPCILHQFFVIKSPFNAILVAIHCFVLSYLATLIVAVIKPTIVRRIVQTLIIIIISVDFSFNIYCLFELGYLFDAEFAKMVIDTNPDEAKEFATAMLPFKIVLGVLGVFFVFAILGIISSRHNLNLRGKSANLAMGFLCLCVAENIYSWNVWHDGPINRIMELPEYEVPYDLKAFYSKPLISLQNEEQAPIDVVLIIGESFTRCHSSLYGYEKNTNPDLDSLKQKGLLYTFDSIDAPAPSTAQAIKYMMSTYSLSDTTSDRKWYEYTTLIEIMQEFGYNCYWFSNQARGSKHNGISRALAGLCERQWFLQNEGSEKIDTQKRKLWDIVLVDSSYNFVRQLPPQQHSFVVYHMMGSHFHFAQRYPEEYASFSAEDYLSQPQVHREMLAHYDNSILYNDHIVSQIINIFSDKDAIVIYLPDHGQVMYRDKRQPDYFAHGRKNDPISYALGIEIPFFVYASPLFQEKHPETTQRIKDRQNNPKPWNSDDLPYLIMDIIGVSSIDGETIEKKSILN